ncbi:cupin domain-containing protein [Devosia lacusdianchii]|uniref:cupin domain-containing protein n=1 Tax=Devosia lacusdianchii TaxID=2917991 RepID=UPI001F050882|nr:cupin domain-containing protein [Devosia sp. JXJ CY 41]
MSKLAAKDVIFTLGMERHPEGGWYARTFEDQVSADGRAQSTAIYYLLEAGDASHWHRVDAVEVWHYYAGAPLNLRISDGKTVVEHRLGNDLHAGERPQVVVPRDAWQSAVSTGGWTLVGCTVAPGFQFSGFELADPDWEPGKD